MVEDMSAESLLSAAQASVAEIASHWKNASINMIPVAANEAKTNLAMSDDRAWYDDETLIAKGKALFHGPLANCASCHGEAGNGNATTLDFDDWTKEYTTKLGISPSDAASIKTMKAAGALTPRQSLPRKLQWGIFHGDDSDEALYRRLVVGVAGTPMPGLLLKDKPDGVGAEPADVWAIIAYIRSLSSTALVARNP